MDREEARRVAVAHFTDDGTQNAGWTITGPTSQAITTLTGERAALVFKFRPPVTDAWTRRSSPMSVAVDVETGVPQTLE
ncbi:hypothetical protein [Streptomyces sp. NBC_01190]|uniref:hypothetical protein n=1 Tax=Streptomyces sp. NBC_01190 TaxID=2903767 RepID=UPI00386B05D3|nr:hypothetical protein OG519_15990 [Streptomyces sp. NBC_01190]